MAAPPLGLPLISPGFPAREGTPDAGLGQLYLTPEQCDQLYGLQASEGQIRFAMALMHGHCNRTSLWVEEYQERLTVPEHRQSVQLAYRPVVRLVSASGWHSYGRRDQGVGLGQHYDVAAAVALYGMTQTPVMLDTTQMLVTAATGECWLPGGFALVPFGEIEVAYLAGLQQIPDRIKAALAEILNTVCAKGVSDRTEYSVGRTTRRYASEGFLTKTAMMWLEPFVVRTLG